jgi:hypothetical protein
MHSLIGTFIKEMPIESSKSEGCDLYPVKIVLPPNKSRILYFKDKNEQMEWHELLATHEDDIVKQDGHTIAAMSYNRAMQVIRKHATEATH